MANSSVISQHGNYSNAIGASPVDGQPTAPKAIHVWHDYVLNPPVSGDDFLGRNLRLKNGWVFEGASILNTSLTIGPPAAEITETHVNTDQVTTKVRWNAKPVPEIPVFTSVWYEVYIYIRGPEGVDYK